MVSIPPFAVLLIAVGLPLARWPYQIAMISEVLDAIGRKPAGPVEPADWNVTLTRVGGIGMVAVGVAMFVIANT